MNLFKSKYKKGSAEIVAVVILVVLVSITSLVVGKTSSKSTLGANKMAQQTINFNNEQ